MFSWHAVPFARLLIPYILGVFFGIYSGVNYFWFLALFLLAIVVLILRLTGKAFNQINQESYVGISIFTIFLSLGFFITKINISQKQSQLDHWKNKWALIEFENTITEKNKFYRCYATLINTDTNRHNQKATNQRVLIYVNKNFKLKPKTGVQWLIVNRLNPVSEPLNLGEFNYKQYLSYQGIYYQQFVDSSSFIKLIKKRKTLKSWAWDLRKKVLAILNQFFGKGKQTEKGIAEAVLLGYKDNLEAKVVNSFSHTGTLHVLAVSGLHAGIIFIILGFLSKPLLRFKHGWWIQVVLILLFLWVYAFVTGLSTSVVRATVMFSIISVSKLLKTKTNIFNTIYSSAFILLLINPLIIVDVGFQLSYSAVLGIVYIQPKIRNWYLPSNKITKYIWDILAVSLAAQIMTFPIGIFYFHQFPNYFFFSNLFIIPLTFVTLFMLILLVSFSWIPVISVLLGLAVFYIIKFTVYLVGLIENLPYSFISGLHITFVETILIYLIIFLVIKFFEKYKAVFIISTFLFIFILFSSISYRNYNNKRNSFLVINKINNHDVFTFYHGKTVYILSDSTFLNNKEKIRFHLEPFFWEKGINNFKKVDLNSLYKDNLLKNVPKKGFFYKNLSVSVNNYLDTNFQFYYFSNKYLFFRTDSTLFNKRTIINFKYYENLYLIDSLPIKNCIKLQKGVQINCHGIVTKK